MSLEFLYQALSASHGICVRSDDVPALQQRLYKVRREACDPALDVLSLVPSPTDSTELWIVKKGSSGAEERD